MFPKAYKTNMDILLVCPFQQKDGGSSRRNTHKVWSAGRLSNVPSATVVMSVSERLLESQSSVTQAGVKTKAVFLAIRRPPARNLAWRSPRILLYTWRSRNIPCTSLLPRCCPTARLTSAHIPPTRPRNTHGRHSNKVSGPRLARDSQILQRYQAIKDSVDGDERVAG